MNKKIFTVIGLLLGQFVFAQLGGRETYQFLNLPISPSQAALGGKNVTVYNYDVNQAFMNPASINEAMDNQVALNFSKYYGDLNYGTMAYSKKFKNDRQFQIGVQYLNYGSMDGYDENGFETGSFTGNEVAVSVGYSHHITGTNFYVGSNLKVISSKLESYGSFAAGFDFGGMYVNPETGFNAGLTLRNVGTQLDSYNDINENLPFEITAGISKRLENVPVRWHLTLENLQKWNVGFSNPNRGDVGLDGQVTEEKVSFFNNAMRHVIIGAELFPEKKFNIRLAYNFRKGYEMKVLEQKNFSGFSAGFGFRYNRLRFDYSYSRFTLAANTSMFGLSLNLK